MIIDCVGIQEYGKLLRPSCCGFRRGRRLGSDPTRELRHNELKRHRQASFQIAAPCRSYDRRCASQSVTSGRPTDLFLYEAHTNIELAPSADVDDLQTACELIDFSMTPKRKCLVREDEWEGNAELVVAELPRVLACARRAALEPDVRPPVHRS